MGFYESKKRCTDCAALGGIMFHVKHLIFILIIIRITLSRFTIKCAEKKCFT